jgi:hypothetical protein
MLKILISGRWFILQYRPAQNVLDDAFSSQLNNAEPVKPAATLAERTRKWVADLSNIATRLDVTKEVLDVFPDPHPEIHLDIIVTVNPTPNPIG